MSAIGRFTVQRLRLNRTNLVRYRLIINQRNENEALITQYQSLLLLQQQLSQQLFFLNKEQREHLEKQQRLIEVLINLEMNK